MRSALRDVAAWSGEPPTLLSIARDVNAKLCEADFTSVRQAVLCFVWFLPTCGENDLQMFDTYQLLTLLESALWDFGTAGS